MNKDIFCMKRKHLLVGFIILGLLLIKTNVQAQDNTFIVSVRPENPIFEQNPYPSSGNPMLYPC
ncbi:MAG: hypothetical protein C0392_15525 [Syntrophus sp. (in: bacteria)]|nr:hypothetical protein [Syntrophus sp. (in: bacteria)]